ncbi:MAG TPA: PEP/pyruvate-binding domain-containing protein [Gaiellaceae bacterium]|nr:PEP/pyruvate-binding domain-containing protein [Gaiellaceae bacterium]
MHAATAPLHELGLRDEERFGGKSAALGELLAGGIPVPGGFAVSVEAYSAFLAGAGLRETVDRSLAGLDADDLAAVQRVSAALTAAIGGAELPGDLRAELVERYAQLGDDPPVAVRSSALGEDSAEATFAGQQETYLWVRGADAVCRAVQRCWASLHSPPSITYRAQLGDTARSPAMGVTVQRMVDAEVAGVLFTCNPVSGDPSVVAIDASWGLGLAVVGGEVTPDEYLVSKVTGEVVRSSVNAKLVEYRPDPDGAGTVRIDVPAGRATVPCLDDAHRAELLRVAGEVERHFGCHQDVEWAIDGSGRTYVLQARPVTAVPRPPAPTAPSGDSALALVMSALGVKPPAGGGSA